MPARKLKPVEANDGSYAGLVLAVFDRLDVDEPVLNCADDDKGFTRPCPKCGAKADEECTSLISGCCIKGMHADRLGSAA
jgi:hypothetical protein